MISKRIDCRERKCTAIIVCHLTSTTCKSGNNMKRKKITRVRRYGQDPVEPLARDGETSLPKTLNSWEQHCCPESSNIAINHSNCQTLLLVPCHGKSLSEGVSGSRFS